MGLSSNDRISGLPERVGRTIDEAPLTAFQVRVAALCGCVAVLDGFDGQAIAFAGPALIRAWGLTPSAFAWVVSIGLVGTLLGASLQGPFADRIGRRPLIIAATFLFAVCAMGCALAATPVQLTALRFVSGLGLGAAMVNIVALTGEIAPKRNRAFMIATMASGLPVGVFLCGLLSSLLIEGAGWRAIFWAGGLAPLLLGAVLLFRLPESPLFRAVRGRDSDIVGLNGFLARMGQATVAGVGAAQGVTATRSSSVTGVVSDGRLLVACLLGAVFFFNQLVMFFLFSWTPTVLAQTGLPLHQAVLVSSAIGLGSVFGGFVLSLVSDRNPRLFMMALAYGIGAGACVLFGVPRFGAAELAMLALAVGFFVGGGQGLAYAMAVTSFPVEVRARGLGILVTATRAGAICGPLLGGALQTWGWHGRDIFATLAGPLLLLAVVATGAQLAGRRNAERGA